jgi:hypothetical protein
MPWARVNSLISVQHEQESTMVKSCSSVHYAIGSPQLASRPRQPFVAVGNAACPSHPPPFPVGFLVSVWLHLQCQCCIAIVQWCGRTKRWTTMERKASGRESHRSGTSWCWIMSRRRCKLTSHHYNKQRHATPRSPAHSLTMESFWSLWIIPTDWLYYLRCKCCRVPSRKKYIYIIGSHTG